MDELYSRLTYLFSVAAGTFSGLSLYEWGFLSGVIASILLGVLTYRLNKREQMKRTRIFERYFDQRKVTLDEAHQVAKASQASPKDL
ncbi:potassium channel protein [Moellerella wisconsensis]|uniref:potassium channel protein n=1 Tax=Moellerella wisconsensis TaxID=158849 RepID=UPI0030760E3B